MDFLDPKKKRARKIRLAIGHALMVFLVFIATYILVFRAYGYVYDTKTGEILQDGLVYIDSAPDGADIMLNGKHYKSQTNTRVDLPEGRYDLEISKKGYHTWKQSFDLDGGEVLRFAYPMLLPSELDTSDLQDFKTPVTFASQSPDRRWIVASEKNKLTTMSLFELQKRSGDKPALKTLSFQSQLFHSASGSHTLKLVEWSTDNRHLLVKHSYKGGFEFLVLDIQQPNQSYNVEKVFNRKPDKTTLFDKKFDKLVIYDAKSQTLYRADEKTRAVQTFAKSVITYKTHGDDTLVYSRPSKSDKTKAEVIMRQKDKDYEIKEIPLSDDIPLDVARYSGNWYMVVGVQKEHRSYVYKDPVDFVLDKRQSIKAVRAIVLRNSGHIDEVSFSQNARFIASHSRQNFSIYDAEMQQHYSYTVNQKLDFSEPPVWMDGHRLQTNSGGKVLVFDFDGTNRQSLVFADPALPVMFSRDYKEMYSFNKPSSSKVKRIISITQLRTPEDR